MVEQSACMPMTANSFSRRLLEGMRVELRNIRVHSILTCGLRMAPDSVRKDGTSQQRHVVIQLGRRQGEDGKAPDPREHEAEKGGSKIAHHRTCRVVLNGVLRINCRAPEKTRRPTAEPTLGAPTVPRHPPLTSSSAPFPSVPRHSPLARDTPLSCATP